MRGLPNSTYEQLVHSNAESCGLGRWQAPDTSRGARLVEKRVVEVAAPALCGVGWRVESTIFIGQLSMQHSAGRQILATSTFDCILAQQLTTSIPGRLVDEAVEMCAQPLQRREPRRGRPQHGLERRAIWDDSAVQQALAALGTGLEVEAWSTADDIIEQVRLRKYPFALGVQYHPERDVSYSPLFDLFVSQIPRSG